MGKVIKMVLILLLCGICVWTGLALAVQVCELTTPKPQKADCIIVLGAKVNPNGTLSTSLLRRVEKALSLWEEGLGDVLIVCGAQGGDEPSTEAYAMRKWLMEHGVPEESILTDDTSTSTLENMRNAKAVMAEHGLETCIVTTNAYHLRRAMWLAGDAGLNAQGAAAPNNDTLATRVRMRYREGLSWVKYGLLRILGA